MRASEASPMQRTADSQCRQRAVKAGGAALLQARMADFHREDTLQAP